MTIKVDFRLILLAALVLVALALAPCASAAEWPAWLESWLYNSRERTASGIAALESGQPEAALAPLDTVRRLEPQDPRSELNAGTARLAAKRPDAAPVLEAAAQAANRQANPELAALAHYNLGNARLGTGDAGGAVEAYKQALRERPGFQEAKFNLELALRQQQQQQQDQQDQQKKNQDQKQEQQKQDQQQQDQQQQDQQQQDQQQQDQQQKQDQQEQDQQQQQNPQQSQQQPPDADEQRLPQFQDQPDMSAEEAAAILEAVENLEREQRRQAALEAAKTNVRRKKDW